MGDYDDDGVSSADYAYGYTEALVDGVCWPVTFHTYDGDTERVSDGRRRRADFTVALPAAEAARRLRTALDPEGDWVAHVLADAHRELIDLRAGTHADAGGLVIAVDKEHAERLADTLARIAGERPEIVTSDAADASARIARFAAGSGTWLVSVLMVSEVVDVPRLRVGVYATSARTELFFHQGGSRPRWRIPQRRFDQRRSAPGDRGRFDVRHRMRRQRRSAPLSRGRFDVSPPQGRCHLPYMRRCEPASASAPPAPSRTSAVASPRPRPHPGSPPRTSAVASPR